MLLEQLGGAGAVPGTGLPREFPTVAPPFYQHLRVAPVQGQLVAFPGWLVHAVVAAGGTDDSGRGNGKGDSNRPGEEGDNEWRVSFSFNLHGEWEDTSTLLLEQLSAPPPKMPVRRFGRIFLALLLLKHGSTRACA